MPDRVEREIEEILSKLEEKEPASPRSGRPRDPIPLRPRRKPSPATRIRDSMPHMPHVTPATLLFAGAGIMVAGLILSSFVDPLIWLAFLGVIVFLGAFVWAFLRRTTPGAPRSGGGGGGSPAKGVYWRDRYIEYDSRDDPNGIGRFKRMFRRR